MDNGAALRLRKLFLTNGALSYKHSQVSVKLLSPWILGCYSQGCFVVFLYEKETLR